MRKTLLIAALIFSSILGFAQMPGAGGQRPNIGHVYGKVVDNAGKAVGNVSVVLLQTKTDPATRQRKDVLVKGVITKANGEFSLNELPMFGKLKLKVSAMGFKPHEQEVAFEFKMPGNGAPPRPNAGAPGQMPNMSGAMGAFDKDLGNIRLQPDPKQLQGVVVTAAKPLMQLGLDKKTFNVDKNIVTTGGTAVDVMRNVPSVQVDIDGNVKLRNAAPQIYIDGRPTTLTLDQIPADGIESVEVITNPSAKYDASGGNAGILNIVLKKNKQKGYNGNIMAGVDSRGGYNGGGNFNLRQDKFNFSATLMANQMRNRITGTTDRHNFTDTSSARIFQNNLNKTNGGFEFGRLGVDYFVTNRTTLSLTGMGFHGKFKPNETIDFTTDSLLHREEGRTYGNRTSNSERTIKGTTVQFGIKHNFPTAGEEWTADFNYSARGVDGSGLITNTTTNGAVEQMNIMGANNKLLIAQTDYVKPFSAATKLEAGLRAQITRVSNDNENYIRLGGDDFDKIIGATTNFKTTNNVYAAYATLSSAIGKNFGYKVGLRAERSDYTGELISTGQKFKNDYPVSLFPSVFLSQKLKKDQELQLSITRRINRPTFFQQTPYTDYTDNLNITRGNPDLVPEFTNSAEFSYSKTFKGNNIFLASVYYKHTSDLITRYLVKGENPVTGQEAYINTFANANSGQSYGAELTAVNPISKWWDLTTNINIYQSQINTNNVPGIGMAWDPIWSVFGKLNNNFKLPQNFTIQLSADYQSKTNLPANPQQGFGPAPVNAQSSSQGYLRPFYGVDIAVKKTFLKDNAASLTLSVNDIFRTRKSDQYSEGIGFTQNYYRLYNPQLIRLNFAYRFGKMDVSLFKRKNMKNQGEGMQNMDM